VAAQIRRIHSRAALGQTGTVIWSADVASMPTAPALPRIYMVKVMLAGGIGSTLARPPICANGWLGTAGAG
jgi:hypothetical protein